MQWPESWNRSSLPGIRCPFWWAVPGLYVQSFLYGVRFTAEKAPDGLREQLAAELAEKGPEAMYEELAGSADPEAAAAIHPNNQVRVLRALEHYRATGKRLSEQKAESLPPRAALSLAGAGAGFPGPRPALPPHRPAGGQDDGSRSAARKRSWSTRTGNVLRRRHRPSDIRNSSRTLRGMQRLKIVWRS